MAWPVGLAVPGAGAPIESVTAGMSSEQTIASSHAQRVGARRSLAAFSAASAASPISSVTSTT